MNVVDVVAVVVVPFFLLMLFHFVDVVAVVVPFFITYWSHYWMSF